MIKRSERHDDFLSVSEINSQAFQQNDESKIVGRIRTGEHYLQELSLVAEENGCIIGHIIF